MVRLDPGVQSPDETLNLASGSCRDSAWLLVQILRKLGLAARFVSGYLIQLKADVASLDGPSGASEDFCDLHAWAEAYLPGAGWIGLDATSGLLCGEGHIPLAATPHHRSAAPISGVVEFAQVDFEFEMSVKRLIDPVRITKPFEDDAWRALIALGDAVDLRLGEDDVRLTMGGEPTFCSIDDFQSAEWNTDAVGPAKQGLADQLIRRLRTRFAPGGLLQHGQGQMVSRRTSAALGVRSFLAGGRRADVAERRSHRPKTGRPGGGQRRRRRGGRAGFRSQLRRQAGIGPNQRSARIRRSAPLDRPRGNAADAFDAPSPDLDSDAGRRRRLRVFDRGLTQPKAFVLPLRRWNGHGRSGWMTEAWRLRRGRLFLIPGDSPAGFRLPLSSLPELAEEDYPHIRARDPFEARGLLPSYSALAATAVETAQAIRPHDEPPYVRTAVTFEERDGVLFVFMPPQETAEVYLELTTQVEALAVQTGQAVRLEGYSPPDDPRLNVIKVTPDPGVIEVNIQPARSWRQAVSITTGVYEDAARTRLGADKFMIDGRHTGTGGGNHVVVGGASPLDSPFLRRPDLLKSLLLYWQRHPSLSYLFSGLFVGPTSQAPRVDEARHDGLYELEIALAAVPVPGQGETPGPWLVDRLFRNLLADVAGNTHRTEICIDKLYSPDGPAGRLGLLEFRGFEMPPDARMSLAQQLLIGH